MGRHREKTAIYQPGRDLMGRWPCRPLGLGLPASTSAREGLSLSQPHGVDEGRVPKLTNPPAQTGKEAGVMTWVWGVSGSPGQQHRQPQGPGLAPTFPGPLSAQLPVLLPAPPGRMAGCVPSRLLRHTLRAPSRPKATTTLPTPFIYQKIPDFAP